MISPSTDPMNSLECVVEEYPVRRVISFVYAVLGFLAGSAAPLLCPFPPTGTLVGGVSIRRVAEQGQFDSFRRSELVSGCELSLGWRKVRGDCWALRVAFMCADEGNHSEILWPNHSEFVWGYLFSLRNSEFSW